MKDRRINIKTIIIIVLIVIIISMLFIILNMKNKNIVKQEIEKEQLGETTTDNTYISMETHLSQLNTKQQEINNIQNIAGTATATEDKILKDYTVYKNGKLIKGTMENRGAWTNTPTDRGNVTIPAGYHDGSGYVNTETVYNNGYNDGVAAGKTNAFYFNNGASYDCSYNSKSVSLTSYEKYQDLVLNKNLFIIQTGVINYHYDNETGAIPSYIRTSYNATTGKLTYYTQVSWDTGSSGNVNYYMFTKFKILIIE